MPLERLKIKKAADASVVGNAAKVHRKEEFVYMKHNFTTTLLSSFEEMGYRWQYRNKQEQLSIFIQNLKYILH